MLFPSTARQIALVRKVGTYDKPNRVWTIPANHPFAMSRRGREMRSEFARVKRAIRLAGHSAAASKVSAPEFQKYVERADLDASERAAELDSDDQGFISIGTIGSDVAKREAFWKAVDRYERQRGARLQSRIEFELPHWLPASRRRQILENFSTFLSAHGLPHWIAAHRPGPKSDKRAFHGHVVWHDRAVTADSVEFLKNRSGGIDIVRGDPVFARKKDRTHQGEHWIRTLRQKFAEIVNDVLLEEAVSKNQLPPFFFFPGSYEELGIDATPQSHRGARKTAIQRRRSADAHPDKNDLAIESNLTARIDRAIRQVQTHIERLARKQENTSKKSGLDRREEDFDEEIVDLIFGSEQAISGLALIDSYIFDPERHGEPGSLPEKLREFGFFPIELNDLEKFVRSTRLLPKDSASTEEINLIRDGIQAALARLYFLHCLELTAAALKLKVLYFERDHQNRSLLSFDNNNFVSLMRPPIPLTPFPANLPEGESETVFNPELGTLINVHPAWATIAMHFGAQLNRVPECWFIPSNLPAAARSTLLKFFGTIESKISSEVWRINYAEIIARKQNDLETANSLLVTKTSPHSLSTAGEASAINLARPPVQQTPPLEPKGNRIDQTLPLLKQSPSAVARQYDDLQPKAKSTPNTAISNRSPLASATYERNFHNLPNAAEKSSSAQTQPNQSLAVAAMERYQNALKLEALRKQESLRVADAAVEPLSAPRNSASQKPHGGALPEEPIRPLAVDRSDMRDFESTLLHLRSMSLEQLKKIIKVTVTEAQSILAEKRISELDFYKKLFTGEEMILAELKRRNADRDVIQHLETPRKKRRGFEM
jgi:hypothetical protein